eukprot:1260237-Amphidinium_carterae.1
MAELQRVARYHVEPRFGAQVCVARLDAERNGVHTVSPGSAGSPKYLRTMQHLTESDSEATHVPEHVGFSVPQVPILHWAPQRSGMVACDISVCSAALDTPNVVLGGK